MRLGQAIEGVVAEALISIGIERVRDAGEVAVRVEAECQGFADATGRRATAGLKPTGWIGFLGARLTRPTALRWLAGHVHGDTPLCLTKIIPDSAALRLSYVR